MEDFSLLFYLLLLTVIKTICWFCHMRTEQFPCCCAAFQSEREGQPWELCPVTWAGRCFWHSQPVSVLLFQAKSCICHMCGAHLNRLHSCLYCVFFGCFTKKHIHEHAKTKRHNLGEFSSQWCSSSSVIPVHFRPVKWYFLVITSWGREIILFGDWVSLVVLFYTWCLNFHCITVKFIFAV